MNPAETSLLLEGTWIPFKAELGSESAPADVLSRTELTLHGGRYQVRFAGEFSDRGEYTAVLTDGVAMLTLRGTRGTNEGRTILARFQVHGDRLRICYGLAGILPAAFSTGGDDSVYLVSYRRKSPL